MMNDRLEYRLMKQRQQVLLHEANQQRLLKVQPQPAKNAGWLWRLSGLMGLFL